jgi:hypothetical protein
MEKQAGLSDPNGRSEQQKAEHIALPPLAMALASGPKREANADPATRRGGGAARLVESAGSSDELDNESVVRRLIEHLINEI